MKVHSTQSTDYECTSARARFDVGLCPCDSELLASPAILHFAAKSNKRSPIVDR